MIGAQIRKLAKPMIKKVGMIFTGIISPNHKDIRNELAQRSINVQNILSAMRSVIIYSNYSYRSKVADMGSGGFAIVNA